MQPELKTLLALGDSYTIGESVALHDSWPYQLMDRLNDRALRFGPPRIIAQTGWRTDDLERAIQEAQLDPSYDIVSLLIGVNNQYQGKSADAYAADFSSLLNTALSLSRNPRNVFVLSIPDYGFTPFGEEKQRNISAEIDHFNTINEQVTRATPATYINITDISRRGMTDPSLVATDGLHPSPVMYSLWVDRILEHLPAPAVSQ